MRLFRCRGNDAALNLAREEWLTRSAISLATPCFMLWRNAPSIIVGRHQITSAEVNEEFLRQKNIPVIRRITGGGTVYHDLGNLNFTVILPHASWDEATGATCTAPILYALQKLGIPAVCSGRNDIVVESAKISGCARSILQDRTIFHGTLLFDVDLSILSQALNPDKEKILSKGITSVRARVNNIKELLPSSQATMTMDDFIHFMEREIARFYSETEKTQCLFEELPGEVLRGGEELAKAKYRSWDWNFKSPLPCQLEKKLHFPGGILTVRWNLKEGKLSQVTPTGDFFGTAPLEELTQCLEGLVPQKELLLQTIQQLPHPLDQYISGLPPLALATLLSPGEVSLPKSLPNNPKGKS